MIPNVSDMKEQAVLLRDAEAVLECLEPGYRREEFLQEFDKAGWDVGLMREAIRFACNNIAQSDPQPVISFYPYDS